MLFIVGLMSRPLHILNRYPQVSIPLTHASLSCTSTYSLMILHHVCMLSRIHKQLAIIKTRQNKNNIYIYIYIGIIKIKTFFKLCIKEG